MQICKDLSSSLILVVVKGPVLKRHVPWLFSLRQFSVIANPDGWSVDFEAVVIGALN